MGTSQADPRSGYCAATRTYHSVRAASPLPDPDLPLYLPEFVFSLLRSSSTASPTAALIDAPTGARIPFSVLPNYVRSLADFLAAASIRKGQTVLIISPNSIYVPVVDLAVLSLGAILTASNPASTVSEVSYQCRLSKPVFAFVHSSAAHLVPPSLPHPPVIIDSPDFLAIIQSDASCRDPKRSAQGSVGQAVSTGNQADTATILYSSGTTGPVKGVVSTHRNYIALVASLQMTRDPSRSPGVTLVTVPMFHIFGLFFIVNAIAVAETLVFMERFDMLTMLRSVERYRVSHIPASPPLLVALAKLEVVDRFDLSSLESVGSGGAALGKEVIDRFVSRFPNVSVVQGYGLTESTGAIAFTAGPEETARYGAVGKLLPHAEAKIVHPATGNPMPPNMKGELWLRSSTIMKGYLDNEKATSTTLDSEGWLKTGDLCYIDEDGFLFVVDRLKELIKYKGYQVAPVELEQLLQSHPEIADAAVIPYPDDEAGQIPMAFVVRQPKSNLSETQVMGFIAKQVAPYKKVRRVAFVNSIPKTASGKILRRDLIQQALQSSKSRL
ncbi:4-coumarate--CoA ligase-like 5 isoform X1 [Nymphaea colorata]|nr:4-coumarate--CoA ligase-like 5 isoform X1 [Nymphaea colorata]